MLRYLSMYADFKAAKNDVTAQCLGWDHRQKKLSIFYLSNSEPLEYQTSLLVTAIKYFISNKVLASKDG